MDAIRHARLWPLRAAGGLCLFATLPMTAFAADDVSAGGIPDVLPLALAIVGLLLGIAAIFIAFKARSMASAALQEAGEARARTQAAGQTLSAETLAATERVWSTRLNALEAQ